MSTFQLDGLNIGLMLVALGLALVMPFEVFILGYAFIGPLHYITEISWLHDRKNFCANREDGIFLILPAILFFLGSSLTMSLHVSFLKGITGEVMFFTFFSALVYLTTKNVWKRLLGLLAVLVGTVLYSMVGEAKILTILFLPTLIHVFVFTGFFILLGALRNRSWSGFTSLAVFLLCAVFCFINPFDGLTRQPGAWARENFPVFARMNAKLIDVLGLHTSTAKGRLAPFRSVNEVLDSGIALKAMSFICFAYLYHYFNWFSKTGIIGWHKISRRRAIFLIAAWVLSAGLYLYDYMTGLTWLFMLSVAHVTLEFPLNWLSIKESVSRITGLHGIQRKAA